jgi:hypothetical protein
VWGSFLFKLSFLNGRVAKPLFEARRTSHDGNRFIA